MSEQVVKRILMILAWGVCYALFAVAVYAFSYTVINDVRTHFQQQEVKHGDIQ